MTLPAGASIVNDSSASGGKAVLMGKSGYLSGQVNLPSTANGFAVVAKAGASCKGSASIRVQVDNTVLVKQTRINSTSYVQVNSDPNISLASGTHSLRIYMDNPNIFCSHALYVDTTNFYGTAPTPRPGYYAFQSAAAQY